MKSLTFIKNPNIYISSEDFVYNYYSKKESIIDDKKFVVFDEEEEYYAIATTDARQITEPRYINFNINIYNLNQYNQFNNVSNSRDLLRTRFIEEKLRQISHLGSTRENYFDKNKRLKYFNDVNYLKKDQIFDKEIDLTLTEDVGKVYEQLVKFYDEESPAQIIPLTDENRRFINYGKINEETAFERYKKGGDSTIIDRSIYRRIKNSNKKHIASYLEDKQSESLKNLKVILQQNDIESLSESLANTLDESNGNIANVLLRQRNHVVNFLQSDLPLSNEEAIFNFADAILSNNQTAEKEMFTTPPKILGKTLDFVEGLNAEIKELNEVVVGVLLDKYFINESGNKTYLCSKFINTLGDNRSDFINIKDNAVRYGRTYNYEVRPVFIQSKLVSPESPSRTYYLILGNRSSSYAIKCVERESPLPPSHLEVDYIYSEKGIELTWGLPRNRQRDIVNFQVFRRESPYKPFKLIKEYRNLNVNVVDTSEEGFEKPLSSVIENTNYLTFSHVDKNIKNNKIYIYAVCCVDAHGLSSAYSTQVATRFNGLTSRIEVDTISLAGALKQYPNQFFLRKTKFYNFENDVISNTPIIKNKKKMNVYFTPDYETIVSDSRNIDILSINNDELNNKYYSISLTDINTLGSAQQQIFIRDREN